MGYPGPVTSYAWTSHDHSTCVCEIVLEASTPFPAQYHTFKEMLGTELSNKTFYNDGNVLFCCCPQPLTIWLWSSGQ